MGTDRGAPSVRAGFRRAALAAALLALAVAAPVAPASAQGPEDRPIITFRLVLYGDPPAGEVFWLGGGIYGSDDRVIGAEFCGNSPGAPRALPPCEGGGTVYAGVPRPFYSKETLGFSYLRDSADRSVDVFLEGSRAVGTEDVTITAYYDYRTGEGGLGEGPGDQQGGGVPDNQQEGGSSDTGGDSQDGDAGAGDDQQTTPAMPATGAGGRVGSFPLGPLAGGAALLGGACVAGRWRQENG